MINKVCLLAAANSIHTIKWVNALVEHMDVVLVSQHSADDGLIDARVACHTLSVKGAKGYLFNVGQLKRILKQEAPDVLNVHYVSGYGTLVCLTNPDIPVLMNAWGSDVYRFPSTSLVHQQLVRWNLSRVDRVASTSQAMAEQIATVCPELDDVLVTPFGVDMTHFAPRSAPKLSEDVVIGTIKTMSDTYGVDTLIRSVHALIHRDVYEHTQLSLVLVGDGPDKARYQKLVTDLGLSDYVTFVGRVAHDDVVNWLHKLDVYVALSRHESFGVAIVEAQACGLPVVVSRVGGLPEVVEEGVTGFVVDIDNAQQAADKLAELIESKPLRHQMGAAGRQRMLARYEWGECVRRMMDVYTLTHITYKEKHT